MREPPSLRIDRRSFLKGAAGAIAISASSAAQAAEKPASTRPGDSLRLGIFTSVYAQFPLEEGCRRIREDGFRSVVLEAGFKDVRFDPWAPNWDDLRKIRACLERNELAVAGLYGYYNVIDPDPEKRTRGEQRIHLLIENWKRFGSPVISTETGSYNTQSEFLDHPKNFTEEGYVACRDAFRRLAAAAEKAGAVIAIEAYWRNVIDSADRAERLFKEVDSPALKLTMDPCNYYRDADLERMDEVMNDIFRRVGDRTVIAHAKDVRRTPTGQDHPAAGLGVLNYPLYVRLLRGLKRPVDLVVEHLAYDDVRRARDYVRKHLGTT